MIELLSLTCGYLLKNEPELKKEVHGIMRPIVMTQTERAEIAEYEIKLINEKLEEEKRGKQKAEKKHENAIRKLIDSTFPADISKQSLYKCGLRIHPFGHFTFNAGCDIC